MLFSKIFADIFLFFAYQRSDGIKSSETLMQYERDMVKRLFRIDLINNHKRLSYIPRC